MTWLLLLLLSANPDPIKTSQSKFEAGDFEGALQVLDAAVKSDPTAVRRGELHLARARCLNALRRNTELDPALEAALRADPTLSVGTDDSPGFRATFERMRSRLAGTIVIETQPPGGAVKVDGALVGRAPVTQLLPVGRYRVSVLDDAGNEGAALEIVVSAQLTQTVKLTAPVSTKTSANTPPVEPKVTAPAEPLPIAPMVALRGVVDPAAGVAIEGGVGVLGKYWLAELDVVGGGAFGLGLRAGPRIGFLNDLLGLQLTADGVLFFRGSPIVGGGGTLSFVVHPVSFFDVLLEGSVRAVQTTPGFRNLYGLIGLTLRLRWPG